MQHCLAPTVNTEVHKSEHTSKIQLTYTDIHAPAQLLDEDTRTTLENRTAGSHANVLKPKRLNTSIANDSLKNISVPKMEWTVQRTRNRRIRCNFNSNFYQLNRYWSTFYQSDQSTPWRLGCWYPRSTLWPLSSDQNNDQRYVLHMCWQSNTTCVLWKAVGCLGHCRQKAPVNRSPSQHIIIT